MAFKKNILIIIFSIVNLNIHGNKINLKKHEIKINDEYFYVYDFHKNENIKNTFVILPSYSYFDAKSYIEKKIYKKYEPNKDFEILINELCKKDSRVIVIEYFGYNNSGETKRERTSKNICEEIHIALSKLNIKQYFLIPHSISGLYSLDYITKYSNEIKGIIGIDITLPYYYLEEYNSNEDYLKNKFNTEGQKIPEAYIKMYDYFWTISNHLKDFKFNNNLPVLLFTSTALIDSKNEEIKNKTLKTKVIDYLKSKITNKKIQKIITLKGTHYLHHSQYKCMSENIIEFANKYNK